MVLVPAGLIPPLFRESTSQPAYNCTTQPTIIKHCSYTWHFGSLQHAKSIVHLLAISQHVEHELHLIFFSTSLTYEYPKSLFPQNKCFILLKSPSQPIDGLVPIPQNTSMHVQIYTSISQYLLIDEMKEQPSGHICLASIHDYKLNIPPMAPKTSNKELLFTRDAQPGSGKGYELSLSQGYLHST